jgi:cell division protease FtsH
MSPFDSREFASTINELLVQIDGFSSDPRIIVMAATNHTDKIDAALKRRGRFDYIVTIPLPDEESRLAILTYYLTNPRFKRTADSSVDLSSIAQRSKGLSGADLEGLVDDAALEAGRNKRSQIYQADLDNALAAALLRRS